MRRERGIVEAARSQAEQVRHRWQMLFHRQRDVHLLFLDDTRRPTEATLRWLDRVARENYVHSSAFHDDPREHARREGRRELALEIIASVRLDPARLEKLAEQMREIDDE